jgi:hypothetical protein
MLAIVTCKYGCNPNLKIVIKKLFVVCVEEYWPTSIISHNRLPLFHSSPTSCSSIINKLAHHSELFYTFYKKLIMILQKYNQGYLPYNCYTNQTKYI